jgi:hypothetical protein
MIVFLESNELHRGTMKNNERDSVESVVIRPSALKSLDIQIEVPQFFFFFWIVDCQTGEMRRLEISHSIREDPSSKFPCSHSDSVQTFLAEHRRRNVVENFGQQ